MRCMECGADLRETNEPITETLRGVSVTVEGVRHYVCDGCGNIEMDVREAEVLARRQAELVASQKGLLAPSEIRAVRKRLGLTQRELEAILGVSSPTVSRWETGAMLPSKTTDRLIRVLGEFPETVVYLSGTNGSASFEVGCMKDTIISDTEFIRADVLQSSLWANPEQPEDEATLYADLSLDVKAGELERSADGKLSKRLTLTVSVTACDDSEEHTERMRAQITLAGGSRITEQEGVSDEELDRHLAANTVSALYATARTYLEFNTSMMPIQRLTIPAIDPYRVVEQGAAD